MDTTPRHNPLLRDLWLIWGDLLFEKDLLAALPPR